MKYKGDQAYRGQPLKTETLEAVGAPILDFWKSSPDLTDNQFNPLQGTPFVTFLQFSVFN